MVSLGFANQSYEWDLAFEPMKRKLSTSYKSVFKDTENPNSLTDESHYKIDLYIIKVQ